MSELPKNCYECKHITFEWYCELIHDDVFCNKHSRDKNCPLVEEILAAQDYAEQIAMENERRWGE